MKPLFVLLGAFVIALFATKLFTSTYDYPLAGRIAMSVMLLFTAASHFIFTKGMAMMVPGFVPYKTEMVYLTGVIEIIAAIGLLLPAIKVWTAWTLIIFFVILLNANIKAATEHIDYEKGTFEGKGPGYLWFRVPLQLFFIVWTYVSAIGF